MLNKKLVLFIEPNPESKRQFHIFENMKNPTDKTVMVQCFIQYILEIFNYCMLLETKLYSILI